MTDDIETPRESEAQELPQGPLGGERLAEARRAKQVSVFEIAKELHLDETKVRALERNEFDVLGAPVFAKGHLKKYAQLVQVDAAQVVADYDMLNRSSDMPPVVSSRPRPQQELSPGPWIAIAIVLIAAAAAYWLISSDVTFKLPVLRPAAQPEVVTLPDAKVTEPAAEPVAGSVADVASGDAAPGTDAAVVEEAVTEDAPAAEPEPVVDDGQMDMLLTYSGDCWTEISDATGRRLMFALGRDGQTVELRGAAPFNVLFGNPDNVSVRVDGQDYALPANRAGRALRTTIDGL